MQETRRWGLSKRVNVSNSCCTTRKNTNHVVRGSTVMFNILRSFLLM